MEKPKDNGLKEKKALEEKYPFLKRKLSKEDASTNYNYWSVRRYEEDVRTRNGLPNAPDESLTLEELNEEIKFPLLFRGYYFLDEKTFKLAKNVRLLANTDIQMYAETNKLIHVHD